jgi:hypothetical protein
MLLPVNVKLDWLLNESSVYLVVYSLLLIGQQVCNISSGGGPDFPLAAGFAYGTLMARKTWMEQANQILS